MTADERDTIRAAVDQERRDRLQETNAFEARRRRLAAACCDGSPIRASLQVRVVERMLASKGVK
jgi:hypothetical protein